MGVVFVLCGEFNHLAPAIYNSAMLYTTMSWGDVACPHHRKILGPFEAADGLLMFRISTATVIAVIQLILRTRSRDLPELLEKVDVLQIDLFPLDVAELSRAEGIG